MPFVCLPALWIFFLGTALLAFPVGAAAQKDGTPYKQMPAGKYKIDPVHSHVIFAVEHLGFSIFFGRFNEVYGTLEFDPNEPEKSVLEITLDPTSVDTVNDELDAELSGSAEFLNAASYPEINFRSQNIVQTGVRKGQVQGLLTLRGQSRPLTLNTRLNGAGANPIDERPTLGFSAKGRMRRSEWGMDYLVPQIGDIVALTINAEFRYQGRP